MSNARSTPVVDSDLTVALARDVAEGVTRSPKSIPSRYLYDDRHLLSIACRVDEVLDDPRVFRFCGRVLPLLEREDRPDRLPPHFPPWSWRER